MVRVVIADHESTECQTLAAEIQRANGMMLCGIAGSGKELYELIVKEEPDVVVMELVLPYMDGISVLEMLQREQVQKKPVMVVLTSVQSERMIQAAFAAGADYYMLKPYDRESLILRICASAGLLGSTGMSSDRTQSAVCMESSGGSGYGLDREIDRRISLAGVPHHIKGYRYLNTAIAMCIEDMDKLNGVTKDLYPSIAKVYNTTASRVERAIRHAIEVACTRVMPDDSDDMYRFLITPDGKRPTNSEFIAFLSDQIRLQGYTA